MSKGKFKLNGLATAIGSMPHVDPKEACSLVLTHLPEIPAWPQLPQRSFLENMYAQFSEGFPGVVLEEERIWIDSSQDLSKPLEELYAAYLEGSLNHSAVGYEYAEGLHVFLNMVGKTDEKAVKGQVTGPVSWGLSVTDDRRKAIIYDDTLSDAAAKLLRLKASWQEKTLSQISRNTIIFVDEPYMVSFGSAYFSISRERVITLLEEVLGGIAD